MAEFRFFTEWQLRAPVARVFDAILDSVCWPQWWEGLEQVEDIQPGDAQGIGSVRRYVWKSESRYRLCFEARTTRIVPGVEICASVEGDLAGIGRWNFLGTHEAAIVHYFWHVHTKNLWMNLLAPVARPLFRRNHHLLMENGAHGLARRLQAPLLQIRHVDGAILPGCESTQA